MHRIWKALRDRRGFTLIEIAIVIAIIGILLLIALPLFSGARVRAYVAEARQIGSEWKALAWSCLVEKNFNMSKCNTVGKIGWVAPTVDSDAWLWTTATMVCGTAGPVDPDAITGCTTATTGAERYYGLRVPDGTVTGLDHDYLLTLNINTGVTQESPATGEDIETP